MSFEVINIEIHEDAQSIEIPAFYKINDNKAYLKKIGDVLYIIPFHDPWNSLQQAISGFSDDYMLERNEPNEQVRPSIDS